MPAMPQMLLAALGNSIARALIQEVAQMLEEFAALITFHVVFDTARLHCSFHPIRWMMQFCTKTQNLRIVFP